MKPFTNKLHLIYILLLALLPAAGFAQGPKPSAKITGSIITAENKPVEFATVSLLRAKDSSVVKGTLGTDKGTYTLNNIVPGNYVVKATAVGYTKGVSKTIAVNAPATFTVPAISVRASAKTLKTVNIQTAKPLLERKLDRMVMNVENSALAAGNSAMDILERAPGISIDKDDNISLNGKNGVTVMINDKLTYLSSAQLATLLRSTDGNNIATIELITNPSAKYDASGNSGIINIKLKKNRQVGTSGTLTAGAGYGIFWKDNESLSLNHKEGKLNIYTNISHNDENRENNINIKRVVQQSAGSTYFDQNSRLISPNHYNNYRVGADYDLSKKNTIGFVVNGYTNFESDSSSSATRIGKTIAVGDSSLKSNSQSLQHYTNFAANMNDRWQIDTLGQELSIDLDYSRFNNEVNANYLNSIYFANGSLKQAEYLRNQSPSIINIRTAKADYTYPFSKTLKLEAGAKFSNVKTDNNLLAELRNASGNYVNDPSRTNHFIYQEKIDAGYVNLGKSYKNTSFQLGVRAEYTTSNGYLVNSPPVVKHYLDFFPSVFINHSINKKNDIGFSYSRRIDRPDYGSLNPFVFYLDKYTYQQGNPFLKPQYTHALEVDYTWNKTINVALNYSHTTDVINQIILTDTVKKASYQTNLNLQVQNSYSMNFSSPYTIAKWWTGNANVNMFYNKFESNGLLGANLNDGSFAYQARATQNLTFIKGYRIEVTGVYRSARTNGIFNMKEQYTADAGVSHSFANKRANIKLNMSDIFNTRRNNVTSMYQSVNLEVHQKNESRVTRLTFTYSFGNNKIKARQHQTGADAEKSRVGGGN
ncbi:outer membrane beta-barrel family protein [Mucilaginibacter boryungensis]|uniref:TonB-dependent receptor n=1 Tax=Mucilaginibacter boryungensis TaxID=768480 RepID=A0ABR9XNA0_9SPHI|nr:outer membrane beta-barrel family protein [Mucilaginibacter boryungensis]MBE9668700.1 TonB-dependent receptor [Mucilaginibacter boryungensis]